VRDGFVAIVYSPDVLGVSIQVPQVDIDPMIVLPVITESPRRVSHNIHL
jgi:hypothetical protein